MYQSEGTQKMQKHKIWEINDSNDLDYYVPPKQSHQEIYTLAAERRGKIL